MAPTLVVLQALQAVFSPHNCGALPRCVIGGAKRSIANVLTHRLGMYRLGWVVAVPRLCWTKRSGKGRSSSGPKRKHNPSILTLKKILMKN